MSFVVTKGTDDEDATEFVYVACAYACVACENQAFASYWLKTWGEIFKRDNCNRVINFDSHLKTTLYLSVTNSLRCL